MSGWKKGMTILAIFLAIILGIVIFVALFSDDPDDGTATQTEKVEEDPLNLGEQTVTGMIGKRVPFDKWSEWGDPETLEGTGNRYWIAYLDKANISFISDKTDGAQIVIFAGFGRDAASEWYQSATE